MAEEISKYLKGDKTIWAIAIVLSLMSILVVYSATGTLAYRSAGGDTEHFLFKHTFLVSLGFITMWFCHNVDYRYYSRISRIALLAAIPLLIFAWQFGTNINEASRWIIIPFINYSFQPSDLAKLALIVNVASMLSKRQDSIQTTNGSFTQVFFWVGLTCFLIGLTDWSSASLLFITCLLLFFLGRVGFKYILGILIVGAIAGFLAFSFGQRSQTVSNRLGTYLSQDNIPFQTEQSYIAIATGGFTGKGTGKSIQRNFLPDSYSDFIFAIIIEEYGFLGAVIVIGLFLTLLHRGTRIVYQSQRAFGGLLAGGLAFALVLQAFIHMTVVVGLIPITGLTLPILSMGGTSMIFTGMSLGIIISVSRTDEFMTAKDNRKKHSNINVQRFKP